MLLCLSSCSTSFYTFWSCSTYDPSQHTLGIDSLYVEWYKKEYVEKYNLKSAPPIPPGAYIVVDSIPYFYFNLEQKYSWIPIIPIFYTIEFQRSNALYQLEVRVNNNKIYQSFDSIRYTLYDSLGTKCYKGSYVYDWKFVESPDHPKSSKSNSYSIDFKLCENDILYGDMELFFTDFNNKFVVQSIKRIKFNYKKIKRSFYYPYNY